MHDVDFAKLTEDLEAALLAGATRVAILGATPTTLRLTLRVSTPPDSTPERHLHRPARRPAAAGSHQVGPAAG